MERIIYIPGEKISLVIPEKQDLEIMYKGINNINISKFLGSIKHYTRENEEKFLDSVLSQDKIFFVIMENVKKIILGGIGFNEYSPYNRSGIIGISLYDEAETSKGYGTEAMKLFLKYAFEYIGCNKVGLYVYGNNKRALKVYKRCGFREVGTLLEDTYIMGKYEDRIFMEMLRREYDTLKES